MNRKASSRRVAIAFAALFAIVSVTGASLARAADASLAPIRISPERRQSIGLTFATVERKDVSDRIEATGNIETSERLQSYVQTRFAGWIERVFANQTWQQVRKGEPLFTIYSPDLVSTEQEYLLALDADRRVGDSQIAGVAANASSLVDAAAERLKLWAVSPREIARLRRERTVRRSVEIDSPATGYVTERNALPGMYAQPDTRLFTIADLSKVWVYAAVFQNEIGRVHPARPRGGHGRCVSRPELRWPRRFYLAANRSDDPHRESAIRVRQPQGTALSRHVRAGRAESPDGSPDSHSRRCGIADGDS